MNGHSNKLIRDKQLHIGNQAKNTTQQTNIMRNSLAHYISDRPPTTLENVMFDRRRDKHERLRWMEIVLDTAVNTMGGRMGWNVASYA